MSRIIGLDNVIKQYRQGAGEVHAVDGVSLNVEWGEFLSIIGPSGSGKTTLLNLIGCVEKPTSGSVWIDNIEATRQKDKGLTEIRREAIGFVFQQFFLLPTLTALENVQLPALFCRTNRRSRKKTDRARELLTLVGLSNRAGHLPSQLSGGEMQRVAVARALINEPKILLADEPTGNLDSKNADAIMSIFEELNRNGLTIILVTHNTDHARYSRISIHLKDGKIQNQ